MSQGVGRCGSLLWYFILELFVQSLVPEKVGDQELSFAIIFLTYVNPFGPLYPNPPKSNPNLNPILNMPLETPLVVCTVLWVF